MLNEMDFKFSEVGWGMYPNRFIEEFTNELLCLFRKDPPDLILSDSSLPAPAFAAERLNIPWVSIQTTLPVPDHLLPGGPHVQKKLQRNYQNYLNETRDKLGLNVLPLDRVRGDLAGLSDRLHLITVLPELVHSGETFPASSEFIGPCLPSGTESRTFEKDPSRPLILVCTSSIKDPHPKQLCREYAQAAIEAFGKKEVQVVICSNEASPEKLPPNIHWVNTYPNHDFYMPVADIVITHGGCGTLQKGLLLGKPMLIVPLGGDHNVLAQRCKDLGVAEVLPPDFISPVNIGELTKQLLKPTFTDRCAALAAPLQKRFSNKLAASLIENKIFYKKGSHEEW